MERAFAVGGPTEPDILLRRSGTKQRMKLKNLAGELLFPRYFKSEGGGSPVSKGEPNGLESTEDRRSAGRHGNQHVYVRDPQVSGELTSTLCRWTSGDNAFP
jgi:hypothetical protein